MSQLFFPVWKEAPFLRLVPPLMLGIFIQWNVQLWIWIGWMVLIFFLLFFLRFSINDPFIQFKHYWIYGVFVNPLVFCLGILLCARKDLQNKSSCILNAYSPGDWVIAKLDDDPAEKIHRFKSLATVKYIRKKGEWLSVQGSIFIYTLKNKKAAQNLKEGNFLLFRKKMERIRSSGNPGAMDYVRSCTFQQVYLQVFLKQEEFLSLDDFRERDLRSLLHQIRIRIVGVLRRWLTGRKETGLAEALLIGYRNDLDPELLQSYSNTGTVHIIAISGLHLALIYALLRFILKPLYRKNSILSSGSLISIAALWLFAFLSGASPSVLRSALMFTIIIVGECLSRKGSTYNGLFASAFFLLCYNPFWLWDAGFQLSYAAVLSIVLFFQPIYQKLRFQSRILDAIWKSIALCLAAQILTSPISVYHFHQFPIYFLLSNLVAVPLSSVILIGEILICGICFLPWLVAIAGKVISFLCWLMNSSVEFVEKIPCSTWPDLQISFVQLVLLYLAIACISLAMNKKNKIMIYAACAALIGFLLVRTASFYSAWHQQLLIVYNVPKSSAIDCLDGRTCSFFGDSTWAKNNSISRLAIRPSRIMYRSVESTPAHSTNFPACTYKWDSKRIILIDQWKRGFTFYKKMQANAIIISGNPNLHIRTLHEVFDSSLWIFDSSNSISRIRKWQSECDSLGLTSYSIPDLGAIVCNMKDGP